MNKCIQKDKGDQGGWNELLEAMGGWVGGWVGRVGTVQW